MSKTIILTLKHTSHWLKPHIMEDVNLRLGIVCKSRDIRGAMLEFFPRPLRSAAAEAQFPFPGEGVAEGRGRGIHSGRQAAASHKEF